MRIRIGEDTYIQVWEDEVEDERGKVNDEGKEGGCGGRGFE